MVFLKQVGTSDWSRDWLKNSVNTPAGTPFWPVAFHCNGDRGYRYTHGCWDECCHSADLLFKTSIEHIEFVKEECALLAILHDFTL